MKYKPENLKELNDLVKNKSIFLGDIDTSLITDMSFLFCGYTSFSNEPIRKDFRGIENWDVSNVKKMTGMFFHNEFFNADLSKWDVGKVESMESMFCGCENFCSDLSKWDVSNVKSMKSMFFKCSKFNSDLSKWNVSKVKDMVNMFYCAHSFCSDLSKWDVSNVENMTRMFCRADSFDSELNSWDIRKVRLACEMFMGCKSFSHRLDNWDLSNIPFECKNILKGAKISPKDALVKKENGKLIPLSKEALKELVSDENIYLGDIDTSLIADMSYLFKGVGRRDFSGISSWDVSSVTNTKEMFFGCEKFNENIECWDMSNVWCMRSMFNGCASFNQPLNSWNVSSATNMQAMFNGCASFNQPLFNWDVRKVKTTRSMFNGCVSFNQDLNSWKLDNASEMDYMFAGAKNLVFYPQKWKKFAACVIKDIFKDTNAILEINIGKYPYKYAPKSGWKDLKKLVKDESVYLGDIDTSFVDYMSDLFLYSSRDDFSGIENWNVSQVFNMESMFNRCEKFNADISGWDVSNVERMNEMFKGCVSFNQDLSAWKLRDDCFCRNMFDGAKITFEQAFGRKEPKG